MMELMLMLAAAVTQPANIVEPVTCIKTTIDASGRTSKSKVIVSSGNKSHDRGALQFLRVLDFSRLPMGIQLDQTGHVLVRAAGPDTYMVDATQARLLESCPGSKSPGT